MLAALAVLKERDREALTLVAWDGLTPRRPPPCSASRRPGSVSACTAPGAACAPSSPTCAPPSCAATSPQHSVTITPPPEAPHEHRLDTDPELLDLVRPADPMRDPRVQANAGLDTESALPDRARARSTARAPAHRLGAARRCVSRRSPVWSRRPCSRWLTSPRPETAPRSRQPRRRLLRHVRDALVWPPHAIYEEEDIVTTVTARDGARSLRGS